MNVRSSSGDDGLPLLDAEHPRNAAALAGPRHADCCNLKGPQISRVACVPASTNAMP